jgi:hypothetical protein
VGVLVAKHGGDAQGDNIRCIDCGFFGFTGAGWQIGGNNTGRNIGRYPAYNAVKNQIIRGDCQSSPLYCMASYYGSVEVNGMSMEAETGWFGTQTGYDVVLRRSNVSLHRVRCALGGSQARGDRLGAY